MNSEKTKLVETSGGGGRQQKIVTFTPSAKLTNRISALKAFMDTHKEYQYGNSVTVVHGLKVESFL